MESVNTKRDTGIYECSGCEREIYDGNILYDSFLKSKTGSDWKGSVQKFEMNYLFRLAKIQKELKEESYKFSKGNTFIIHERGKTRKITGEVIQDRVVKHALCDYAINPYIKKYMIHDNGASQEGKGISFTRRRLEQHLHQYYRKHGTNEGYILLVDFTKYYDNINHDIVKTMMKKYMKSNFCFRLLCSVLQNEANERGICKGMNIGNQVSQSVGISYRTPVDNYVKIVKGVKFYGAYMDDCYAIHESKEFLTELLEGIIETSEKIGISVNTKKTRICKLSGMWRFLQIQYSLTKTGRVIHKINPKRITAMRRKMKKICPKLSEKEMRDFYRSWMNNYCRYMSRKQRENMDNLLKKLKGEKNVSKTGKESAVSPAGRCKRDTNFSPTEYAQAWSVR